MTSDVQAALLALELPLERADGDYAHTGFHHRWTAPAAAMPEAARVFAGQGYFLEMMTCQDTRAGTGKLRLVYTFNTFAAADRHVFFALVEPGEAAPTVTLAFGAADWFEREVFDMFGVRFDGHPNLTRILLPEDADFYPLLRDFGAPDPATGGVP